jgi:hypothetical protein
MFREYKGWWIEWGCTGSLGCVREFILPFDNVTLVERICCYGLGQVCVEYRGSREQ